MTEDIQQEQIVSLRLRAHRLRRPRCSRSVNIGSQSTGTGAGKVTFNPFSITRKIT
jgi:hypothetical protein